MQEQREDVVDEFAGGNGDLGYPQNAFEGNLLGQANSHLRYLGHANALYVRRGAVVNADARVLGDPAAARAERRKATSVMQFSGKLA